MVLNIRRYASVIWFLGFTLFVHGCVATSTNPLRAELANHGPMALSDDNPYVAANLMLGREMETSSIIKGFLNYRGLPDAVEVKQKLFQPAKVYFFYLDKPEAYLFDMVGDSWLIRGPESIPRHLLLVLGNIKRSNKDVPLLVGGQVSVVPRQGTSTAQPPGTSTEATAPAPSRATTNQKTEQKMIMPLSVIEETPAGDIVHEVTFPGETLRIISGWYTGDVGNADRLARINGLRNPNKVELGTRILVPRYLLRNNQPLPENEVLRRIAAGK